MRNNNPLLVSIVGPTAVGKTSFGIKVADYFNTEILSVDSRQFYKELRIGTAKPSKEELSVVKHHFIDSHTLEEEVSSGKFEKLAMRLLEDLFKQYPLVVAVGGSGLYFKALWEGMDEMPKVSQSVRVSLNDQLASDGLISLVDELRKKDPDYMEQVDQQNPQRVIRALEVIRSTGIPYSQFRKERKRQSRPFNNLIIGLKMERAALYQRIDQRMDEMIARGLFEEARSLMNYKHLNALQTVGYQEIFGYLEGLYDKDEAVRLLKRNSRRYAKRQLTWFRNQENITWLGPNEVNDVIARIEKELRV